MENKEKAMQMFHSFDNPAEFDKEEDTRGENELANRFPIETSMSCILLVQSGTCIIQESLLSLKYARRARWMGPTSP